MADMLKRSVYSIAFSSHWGRQMRFITGPRQSGKTTLSQMKLSEENSGQLYYLWDRKTIRDRYKQNELFFTQDLPPSSQKKHWVCFDEIHKIPKWKNILKGIFDAAEDHYQFIVTGSAKLSLSKKAGDSLAGRYFAFHLFPLNFREVIGKPEIKTDSAQNPLPFILEKLNTHHQQHAALQKLLDYSGFPEPFTHQSKPFLKKWSHDYLDRVINEDIGLLTKIVDRDRLNDLYQLLPEMIGNPISENSLASHLETSPPTIKSYLTRLEDFYLAFRLTPYFKNIKRSLLKASKWYLYDWTRIEDPGKRFENLIAVELFSLIHLWKDLTGELFSLCYTRDKMKQETDFLIVKNNKPWLLVEAKLSDGTVENHHIQTALALGNIPVVQVCFQKDIALQQTKNVFRVSADKFLG